MKRTVLIADENSKARNALRKILESEGYDIVETDSGDEALALAADLASAVFVLPIERSPIHGIRVCHELRALEQYRSKPIIFLAGNSSDFVLHEALTVGGDDFIHKPYSLVTVQARLRIHFQRLEYLHRLERVHRILKQ